MDAIQSQNMPLAPANNNNNTPHTGQGKAGYGVGKGKRGLGMGKGKGALGFKKRYRDNILSVTKPSIRRLARRGGIKRISSMMYDESRFVLKEFLTDVMRATVVHTDHANRRTVTAKDVVRAMSSRGRTIYGFDMWLNDFVAVHTTHTISICINTPNRFLLAFDHRRDQPLQWIHELASYYIDWFSCFLDTNIKLISFKVYFESKSRVFGHEYMLA